MRFHVSYSTAKCCIINLAVSVFLTTYDIQAEDIYSARFEKNQFFKVKNISMTI